MKRHYATAIVATDENWLIGNRPDPSLPGETPWQDQLPVDMRYFQRETKDRPVVFAIPSYESIKPEYRPLKNRTNVIWTRQDNYAGEGTTTVHSLDEAFARFPDQELMICGGGHLYAAAIKDQRVDMVLRTLVHGRFNGNIYFPKLEEPEWVLIHSQFCPAEGDNLHDCTFETYVRREAMVVDPRNARTEQYRQELLEIQRSRQCPYCPGGKTLVLGEDPIIAENSHWVAINSHTPAAHSAIHWVIFPRQHKTALKEISSGDWDMFTDLLEQLKSMHHVTGGAPNIREGDTEVTGATVRHLHFNYIVPDPKADQAVCVWFGQYRNPEQHP
ncbi:MAG: dihydrofolate reductase [Patescibacteria group bacterium]